MPRPTPAAPASPAAAGGRWRTAIAATLLGLALLAAYHGTFRVPFLMDDDSSIARNPSIRSFSTALFPPGDSGRTVSGRPLLNLTFAVNYHLGGLELPGYHAGNLMILFASALLLAGFVRRTLQLPSLAPALGAQAEWTGWSAAALWALHPLQTGAVTYIAQRAELLVGLCYLATCYSFVRAVAEKGRLWPILTFAACLAGMTAKEVMATAPIMLLLFDRAFAAGSFANAWRARGRLHLSLAATWLVLGALVVASGGRGGTVGFGRVSWLDYLGTQGPAITGYLLKSLLPLNLLFDHGAVVEKRGAIVVLGLAVVLLLLVATIHALWRRPQLGFLGAWVFVILAPTSSFIPVASQTVAEHRMHLPLAAIVLGAVLLLRLLPGRLPQAIVAALALSAGLATEVRNRDYRTVESIWEDTLAKAPANARALANLGLRYAELGRHAEAVDILRRAVDLVPDSAGAHCDLGNTLLQQARHDAGPDRRPDPALVATAMASLREAVRIDPANALPQSALGNALLDFGNPAEALAPLRRATELDPTSPDHHFNYANALVRADRPADAALEYAAALAITPDDAEIRSNFGVVLRRLNRAAESVAQLQEAVKLSPGSADMHRQLGLSLLAAARPAEAASSLRESLRLAPGHPQSLYQLATALADAGKPSEAIAPFEELLRLVPPSAPLLSNLGVLYLRTDRPAEAAAQFRRALDLDPENAPARQNLARAQAQLAVPGQR